MSITATEIDRSNATKIDNAVYQPGLVSSNGEMSRDQVTCKPIYTKSEDSPLSKHLVEYTRSPSASPQSEYPRSPSPDSVAKPSQWGYSLQLLVRLLDRSDKYLSSFIQELEWGYWFEMFLMIPTVAYSFIGIGIMVVIYAVVFRSALYLVTALTVLVTNEALKRTIQRPRPNLNSIAERHPIINQFLIKKSSSMPSGDTAQSTVCAVTMIYTMIYHLSVRQAGWWLILLTIPICGFERIYFGKHWIGDTLCGALEGTLICCFICGTVGPAMFF